MSNVEMNYLQCIRNPNLRVTEWKFDEHRDEFALDIKFAGLEMKIYIRSNLLGIDINEVVSPVNFFEEWLTNWLAHYLKPGVGE